jgi:hypothetical protein
MAIEFKDSIFIKTKNFNNNYKINFSKYENFYEKFKSKLVKFSNFEIPSANNSAPIALIPLSLKF